MRTSSALVLLSFTLTMTALAPGCGKRGPMRPADVTILVPGMF